MLGLFLVTGVTLPFHLFQSVRNVWDDLALILCQFFFMQFVLSRRIYSVPYLFLFSLDAKASPMGLSKILHCSVSGRGIPGLLRSGVYLSVSSPFIYSFHFVCLLGKPGVCSSQSFAFFAVVIFGFSLPTSVLRCVIFVRNVISRTSFLDCINRRGECPGVGPLPSPEIVSKLSVRASARGLLFRDPDHLTAGEILYRLPR